jgi:hypothetical protein
MEYLNDPIKAIRKHSMTALDTMKKSLSWKVDDSDSDSDSNPDVTAEANDVPSADAHTRELGREGTGSSRSGSLSVTGPARRLQLRIDAEHTGGYSSSPASPTGALEKRGIGRKNSLSETLSHLVLSAGGRSRALTQDLPVDEGPPPEPSQMTRKQRVSSACASFSTRRMREALPCAGCERLPATLA